MHKSNRGITLIALVITIIVLLILAGVSIAMLTGENGILIKTNESKENTRGGAVKEAIDIYNENVYADQYGTKIVGTLEDVLNELVKQGNLTEAEKNKLKVEGTITIGNIVIIKPGGTTGGLPSTAETSPFLPEGGSVIKSDLDKGLTIKDKNGNEWVWVEVPKSIFKTATSGIDYEKIETDMKTYAVDYRSGYTDTWYSEAQHGFKSAEEYNNLKNKMLGSVYTNGGFYVGRYETGARTAKENPVTTPIIQQDAYPYNNVTCKQAQEQSTVLATGGKTSSLMFGIQWDLIMKYMEVKGEKNGIKVTKKDLKTDSSAFGNYSNATFDIAHGKYSTNDGSTWTLANSYTKPNNTSVLLTTGATQRNSVLNIYDILGNEEEWTLEYTIYSTYPCATRGGSYHYNGSNGPANRHFNYSTWSASNNLGFRVVLY